MIIAMATAWILGFLVPASAPAQSEGPTFQGLGFLDDSLRGSYVQAVSGDGRIVVGESTVYLDGCTTAEAFRWMPEGGMIGLGFPSSPGCDPDSGNASGSLGVAVSADGSVVAGYGWDAGGVAMDTGYHGFRWTAAEGLVPLPHLSTSVTVSLVYGMTANGATILGQSNVEGQWVCGDCNESGIPVTWSPGVSPLPFFLPDCGSEWPVVHVLAQGSSIDGSVIWGRGNVDCESYNTYVLWVNGSGPQVIDDMLGFKVVIRDMSSDGRYLVGNDFSNGPYTEQGFLWDRISGELTWLGRLDGDSWSDASCVSDDGRVVVGYREGGRFIWHAGQGARDLDTALVDEYGLDFTGWDLYAPIDLSADGSVVVGWGTNPDGNPEGWRAVMFKDSDGDGLYDHWEAEGGGIDVNGDGQVDLDLNALGADPMHKDLFVEVDVMNGTWYSEPALDMVREAFFRAPVDNPDGFSGIELHLIADDLIPYAAAWDDDFVAFGIAKDQYFGTAEERVDPNWEQIRAAKKRAFRYCIFANRFLPSDAIGWGEQPGNDFMVAFGGLPDSAVSHRLIASTFMHELGHTLNLQHGGGDSVNFKPNYVSAMNYNFDSLVMEDGKTPAPLDFSREVLLPLDESNLDETIGLESAEYRDVATIFGSENPSGGRAISWVGFDQASYDWSGDGDEVDVGVALDLNWLGGDYPGAENASPGQILNSFNDWALVELPIGTTGSFEDGQHVAPGNEEITTGILLWLRENVPPAPVLPVSVDLACDPASGTLPFDTTISVTLTNNVDSPRRATARIGLTLAGGASYPNWRSGTVDLAGGESRTFSWTQPVPELIQALGQNRLEITAEDVTPAPLNQPPYLPSGGTDRDSGIVTGLREPCDQLAPAPVLTPDEVSADAPLFSVAWDLSGLEWAVKAGVEVSAANGVFSNPNGTDWDPAGSSFAATDLLPGPSGSAQLDASLFGGFGTFQVRIVALDANNGIVCRFSDPAELRYMPPPPDPDLTTVTAAPTAIPADMASTSLITVVPRDSDGAVIGSGLNVALQTTAGTLLGGVADNGDGSYTQELQSSFVADEVAAVSATVEGVPITATAEVLFEDVPG